MTDHDTLSPEIDDALRDRMQRLAAASTDTVDVEAARRRLAAPWRPRASHLIAVAACLLVAFALPVILRDGDRVRTVDQADSSTPDGECASLDPGGQMKTTLVATAAAAAMLVSACGDDEPTLLVRGEVEFVGSQDLGGQSLDIEATEEDGVVTGEARFSQVVLELQCAVEDDDYVIVGGEVTTPSGDGTPGVGERMAVIVDDGEPDRAALWIAEPDSASSCDQFLAEIPDAAFADRSFVDVESGDLEVG